MSTRCTAAFAAGLALSLFACCFPARAELSASLDSASPPVSITLPIDQDSIYSFRMRKRPEILYTAWDWDADGEDVVSNPLYQSSGQQGTNPLYDSEHFVVTTTATVSYLHKEGVIHRDLAARMFFTPDGSSTPLLMADLVFELPEDKLANPTDIPDDTAILGLWQATQVGSATLTYLDGSSPPDALSVSGASWTFTLVPAPASTTILLGGACLIRRRSRR